ncbi:hypothetical protein GWO43_02480 [candidate division KSB1 bacterium]|nr:hypothetical protein [candidate division KSB1 bacterium]NIR69732.1 hypothetical protein [candidate division KSB1 bacterium]NIS22920.1 hypothetical protein [candidate division KSB1 bacterium]NIT69777.1 hypothetical protein [candidate division KSB1 bacterium]NIU23451.1 hypothetical protein [candidate division KSB1 bacterium]
MSKDPYEYSARVGIHPISWEDFHSICKGLARAVSTYSPEIILAIGRGGYYPGTLLSHLLQAEIYPIRLSRRLNDIVRYKIPKWLVEPPAAIHDHRVLIVDEICATGGTIIMAKEKTKTLGAKEVRSAVLYAHTWGVKVPDYIGLITDALILNPWDREILRDGNFIFHPEYVNALSHQGRKPEPSLLINAAVAKIEKS